jgi:protein-tyrosine kinase
MWEKEEKSMQSPIEDIICGKNQQKKGIINFDQMKVISSKVEKHDPSVLMVTSIPAGKSVGMIAAELAAAIVLQGKRVLLVEGDWKKPSLHEWFHMEQPDGIHQEPLKTVFPTFLPGLDVVLANNSSGKPIDIWLSPSFRQHIASWQETYDRVVLSAPSLHSGVEMELLAEECREVVLVLQRKDKTEDIRKIQAKLETAGCKVIGVVYQQ